MKTFAFIFARGGSKGVPGKNFKMFAGKPLISYSIESARAVSEITAIFVSTDDIRIAEIADNSGAIVINRPEELAQDSSAEWLAWQHAVEWVNKRFGEFERFISLPATAPLRKKEDIISCLSALDETIDIVVTMKESNRSPWFNMVKKDGEGNISILLQGDYYRRQDAPLAYDMATVAYVTRPSFIMKNSSIWNGKVHGVIIPEERAIDIDTPLDFKIAEILMLDQKTNRNSHD